MFGTGFACFLLQRFPVFGEEVGAGAPAAIEDDAIALDEVALLFLLEIAEARDERAAAHQPRRTFAVARLGH